VLLHQIKVRSALTSSVEEEDKGPGAPGAVISGGEVEKISYRDMNSDTGVETGRVLSVAVHELTLTVDPPSAE
jgi:hypothetical protein